MSDQELDELFKNASEKYDAPYDPNDWEKLAARLDKETSRSGFWNRKTYLGLSTLLLMGIGSFVVFNNNDKKTANDIVKKSTKDSVVVTHSSVKNEKSAKAIVSLPLTPSEEIRPASNKNTLSTENQDASNIDAAKPLTKKEIVTADKNQVNNSDGEHQNRDLISERKQTEQSQSDIAANNFSNDKTKPNAATKINRSSENLLSKEEIVVTTNVSQLKNIDGGEQQKRDLISEKSQREQSQSDDAANNFSNDKTKLSSSNNNNQNIKESSGNEEIVTTDVKQSNKIDNAEQKNRDLTSEIKQSNQSSIDDEANHFSNEKTKVIASNEKQNNQSIEESFSKKETVLVNNKKPEDISLKHDDENLVSQNNSQPSSNEKNLFLANNTTADSLSESKKDSIKSVADSVVVSDTTKIVTENKDEEKKKERVHYISVKLNVSPDYSSVGYYSPDKSGYNFGVMGEYSLASHWSVSSGGIWTKKIYSGNNIAYPHNGKMVNAEQMNGNCRMIDWPINVNYYFTPLNRLGIYVSAGLSSYFMFNENYTYEVNYNGSEYYHSEQIAQKESEWFKMSNVSFGLQYKLNNRWSLQAEPFAKIPLAGVGQIKLKLVSSGVFFNIKYTFK